MNFTSTTQGVARKYLNHNEVSLLKSGIHDGLNTVRDICMITMCYFHGFRASELCNLRLGDVEIEEKRVFIHRLKNGFSVQHPLQDEEIILLDKWLSIRENYKNATSPYLFLSRRGGRLSRQQIYRLVRKYGEVAGLDVPTHPHMLRHACGFKLADNGLDTRLIQDYLGHRNIQHTVHYTASNASRFRAVTFCESLKKPLALNNKS